MGMKGIILAGGTGSRLFPLTKSVNKHLLPIYDKPMIFYPLATLMSAGIREILLISTSNDADAFKALLGDGKKLGIEIKYAVQEKPGGIAEAFTVGKDFIHGSSSALILGDNVFHGTGLGRQLMDNLNTVGAKIFAYQVSNPSSYGIVEFDDVGSAISIEEKPVRPKSNYAIPGLYFFDSKVVDYAQKVKPSTRGEKEITDVLQMYLSSGNLNVEILPRGTAWLDTGTFSGLSDATNFIRILEERQGQKIAYLEEIAWRQKWINSEELARIAQSENTQNREYLGTLLSSENTRDW
jgi:glucose-1-phosphate thymidylyltransferase